MDHLFLGSIVHSKSLNELETIENGYLAVKNGKIIGIGSRESLPTAYLDTLPVIELTSNQFLLPGFVDCHIHAPQYPNVGLGLDLPLLQWLDTYTFPLESNYKDNEFSRKVYRAVVRCTVSCGTTLAAYFATNYKESSVILAEEAIKRGQRALVGKVCSNCMSPDYYVESTTDSLRDTEAFIGSVENLKSPLVKPIVTPRFAVSCTDELLAGLGAIAAKYDLHIQSHISENLGEIDLIKDRFKGKSYASVYNDFNLLTAKCVLAHGVHLTDDELQIIKKQGTSIAHCPTSNTNLQSGLCDVRRLLNAGVKVGLGTDVSGGNSASMLHAIKSALDVSQHLNIIKKQFIIGSGQLQQHNDEHNRNYEAFNYKNALYLATLAGAQALALDDVCGNFSIGKDFDGLLVDVAVGPLDAFDISGNAQKSTKMQSHLEQMVQKFVYVGDDRNIQKVYVAGKQVKD